MLNKVFGPDASYIGHPHNSALDTIFITDKIPALTPPSAVS